MSLSVNVQGGTGAGRRRVREHEPWRCACPADKPGSRYSCGRCGARRPPDKVTGPLRTLLVYHSGEPTLGEELRMIAAALANG